MDLLKQVYLFRIVRENLQVMVLNIVKKIHIHIQDIQSLPIITVYQL